MDVFLYFYVNIVYIYVVTEVWLHTSVQSTLGRPSMLSHVTCHYMGHCFITVCFWSLGHDLLVPDILIEYNSNPQSALNTLSKLVLNS